MHDPRIASYTNAALAFQKGRFEFKVPPGPEDEVALLGKELVRLGHAIKQQRAQIQKLSSITAKINLGLGLDEILNQVYESFTDLIPYDRIGFALLDAKGSGVKCRWVRSKAPHVLLGENYSAPLKGSSLESIIRTGQPRILNDLEDYLRTHPHSESTKLIVEEGMHSSLTCPIIARGKAVGFIFFSSMRTDTYRDMHVELFTQLAGEISVIIDKSRLYEELLELNELRTKFLGLAAHDLRHPLAVIMKYSEILLDGLAGDLSTQQKQIVSRICSVSQAMLSLLNGLLDVSAIESGQLKLEKKPVPLGEFLEQQFTMQELLAKSKGIRLSLELCPDLPIANIDAERISQVLMNLFSNAFKFSAPGSLVTLKTTCRNSEVHIAIIDQGKGIPAEELGKIFSDFGKTSVKPTAGEKSTGLGLAICKRIAAAHGGRIEAVSKEGHGSTFTLVLTLD